MQMQSLIASMGIIQMRVRLDTFNMFCVALILVDLSTAWAITGYVQQKKQLSKRFVLIGLYF